MKYIEDRVQQSIVNWLRLNNYLFTCTGAGLIKSQRTQIIMKSLGYTKGTPDLIVWIKNGTCGIECKRPTTYKINPRTKKRVVDVSGGEQSLTQKEFEKRLTSISGHHYIVATSVVDVINYFKKNKI